MYIGIKIKMFFYIAF